MDGTSCIPPRSQIYDEKGEQIAVMKGYKGGRSQSGTYAECYICTTYANRLLHEIHAERLDVVLTE